VKNKLHAAALVAVTAVLGCVAYPVTTTVVARPGRRVTAEASKFNVLWLTPLPPETASELIDNLLAQCDGTGLTGVTIAIQRGWAIIGEVSTISASAYCVEPTDGPDSDGGSVRDR